MKMNTSNLMRTVLISALLVSSQPTLFANENNAAVYASREPAASISYIGVQDGYYVFQVNFTKETDNRAMLKITDGNGTELYRTSFTDKVFSRKVKISRDGYKNVSFAFDVKGEEAFTKTYAISTELIEKVSVEEVAKL